MASRDPGVRLEGFREFGRDLRKLEPAAAKELRKDAKGVGERIASEARGHETRGTGRYARSIKAYVTARGVSVGSRLPQAGVLHYGGTIQPRGVPIVFPARPVISETLDRRTDQIVEGMGDAIERAAKTAGWH